jgi:uncharacterized protein YdbL (DUF1318 family)
MKRLAVMCALALLFVGLGCVIRTEHTIDAHITLDIRHIADQASGVLDFVQGKSDTLPGVEAAPKKDDSTSWLQQTLDLLNPMPVAYAAELNTTSDLVKEIAVKMRERNDAVEALKKLGCLGENNRGYLELRDSPAMTDNAKRNEAQKLLADENKDRKALYNEIARLNKDRDVSVSIVEGIYAVERLKRAKSGEIFQLPPAGEAFDSFKASAAGKALGGACAPNAWVTIP